MIQQRYIGLLGIQSKLLGVPGVKQALLIKIGEGIQVWLRR